MSEDRDMTTTALAPQSASIASPGVPALPWRRIALRAGGIWLVTRVALALFTYFAVLFHAGQTTPSVALSPHLLLASWLRWDAGWYTGITRTGYAYPRQTVFFPLYVLLTQAVAAILGSAHILLAAMLVSNLATLAAFIGLAALAVQEGMGERVAYTTVLVFAAFPLAFFLAAAYTEGLFVACAAWALLAVRRGWWYRAGLFALLAGLTRSTAVILVLPLAYEFARQHGWLAWLAARWAQRPCSWGELAGRLQKGARSAPLRHRYVRGPLSNEERGNSWQEAGRTALRFVVAACGALGAIARWAAFCGLRFGAPLAVVHQEAYWHHVTVPPWQTLGDGFVILAGKAPWSWDQARFLVDFVPVLAVLLLALLAIRRMPVAFTLYTLGLVILVLSNPVSYHPPALQYDSFGRYMIPAIPIVLLLGGLADRHPWLQTLLVSGGFMLQAVLAAFFLTGGWLI
jgi:hypothetical protein